MKIYLYFVGSAPEASPAERLFHLLCDYLLSLSEGILHAGRVLSAGLSHVGASAATAAHQRSDGFDQVSWTEAMTTMPSPSFSLS